MNNLSIDYRLGYRYASEMLDDNAARQAEVLVSGLPRWKQSTAANLIAAAESRRDEGINAEYQAGVIARAQMELEE